MERVPERFPKGSLRSRYPLFFILFFCLLIPLQTPAQEDGSKDTAASNKSASKGSGSGLDGKALFDNNCATCHHPTKELQAPPLKGASKKWKEAGQRDLLYKWVRNPNEVAEMGNDYVDQLIEKWKPKYGMMSARNVSNKEIDAILSYVNDYKPPKDKGGNGGDQKKVAQKESDLLFWFMILGVVFLIVILSLNGVRKSLLKQVREKESKPAPAERPIKTRVYEWMVRHKVLTSLIVIFLVLGGLKDGWDALMGIGVYKGYQPEQPIKFSHKLHAGENNIDCQYCHSSVKESKYPTIPSAMVCMNCHKAIQKGPKHGKKEIAKIYDAVGWNADKRQYTGDKEPIKWVKVHELPDLVYFNHSQHTNVAGLKCKKCHGEVRKMEEIQQKEKLTMGWCLDCHTKTKVEMKGNGYYQEILDRMPDSLHKKYLHDEKVTVRELGGWECAKCHY
ncbi:MAG: c-type cytochrome [Flavobacteriales bacterium]